MARDTELIQRRNAAIRKDYDQLRGERKGKVRKYTTAYVVHMLAERYYLSTRTIEKVLWG